MLTHLTGSDGSTISLGGIEGEPLALMIVMPNGDTQMLMSPPPEEDEKDQELIDGWVYALNLTNYLTHCLLREDWFDEWAIEYTSILEEAAKEVHEEEVEKKRSAFKLLKGGKDDK